MSPRGVHSRSRLTRSEIVDAALSLLDEVGLDNLTARRLAARLGVQAGAIYWYFESKQQLLAAMADRMVEDFCSNPMPTGSWDEQVTSEALRLRRLLLSRRDGARLLVMSLGVGVNIFCIAERFLHILRKAGFQPEVASDGFDTIVSYITGYVLQEQSAPHSYNEMTEMIDTNSFPYLAEWLAGPYRPLEEGFVAKLKIILRGLSTHMP